MLGENTFRVMMLVGGIIVLALFITGFFVAPLVPIDEGAKGTYENVMNENLGDANHLTGYQALQFTIQGRTIGVREHY